jgi:predicted CopG family antitoxin
MNKSYTNVTDSEATTTNKRCTISVDPKVYLRLKKEGIFGESFSELVGRLLDLSNERKRLEQEKPERAVSTKKTLRAAPWIETPVQTATAANPPAEADEIRHE